MRGITIPNKYYNKGYRNELLAKKYLEQKGYVVFRSAGSHSPADLIAVGYGGIIKFIQIKSVKDIPKTLNGKFKKDSDALKRLLRKLMAPRCYGELWVRGKGKWCIKRYATPE